MNVKEVKADEILHIKIKSEDKELLRQLAEREGRSMSNMVIMLIRQAASQLNAP